MNQKTAITEVTFYILLSVFKPIPGYGIMQNIKKISNNRVQVGSGTLYGALALLTERNLITSYYDGEKKKYIITELGIELVQSEIKRLNELLDNGKKVLREEKQK